MKRVLHNKPEPYRGGYEMHVDCKYAHEYTFTDPYCKSTIVAGETRQECFKQLRDRGWIIHRDRTTTCPDCAKKV